MQRITEMMLVACLLVVMSFLQQTTAAPSWRPQGRFGKRGDTSSYVVGSKRQYWRPQGRYGKRGDVITDDGAYDSVKMPTLSGEIEFPVEAMVSRNRVEALRVAVKICSLNGAAGFPLCNLSSENTSETY